MTVLQRACSSRCGSSALSSNSRRHSSHLLIPSSHTSISASLTSSSSSRISAPTSLTRTQVRTATFLRRPRRPYTFTQLVVLSDGSAYQQRTTSPVAVQASLRDARNTLLWNPSSERLMGVESDEAGRLAAFRQRFGRGWDARDGNAAEVADEADAQESAYRREQAGEVVDEEEEDRGGLMDLISEFAQEDGGNKGKK